MSLSHILLGLIEQPASGYDIKQTFDEALNFFWSASLAQIYPALKKLEAEGLANSWPEPSDKGPDRKVYQRTEAGRDAFRSWLAEGPELKVERRVYLAQAYFLAQTATPSERRRFFEKLREEFRTRLEHLRGVATMHGYADDPGFFQPSDAIEFYERLTFDLGLRIFELYLAWADDCLDRMDARDRPA